MAKYSADRVRNVSTVWLGATLGCAECHDHKFDPFTTREFYSLAAFFADIKETAVGVQEPTPFPDARASRGAQDDRGRDRAALKAIKKPTASRDDAAGRARKTARQRCRHTIPTRWSRRRSRRGPCACCRAATGSTNRGRS